MRHGNFPKRIELFDAYIPWRERRQELIESGQMAQLISAGQLEEADSKFDFPSFLYGPVRQSMWAAYDRVEPQYLRFVRVENAPDFRERRLRGLTGMTKPGYVGDHGEYPAMRRGERPAAALVVDTYGGVYSMTRQLIINDESNELLNSAPTEMGDSAAEFIVETVLALIESNPTAPDGNPVYMTSGARSNQITTALSEDSLALLISRLTKQRDDTNRRIRVEVGALAVGDPLVQLIAQRIVQSTETGSTANDTASAVFDKGRRNVLSGILDGDQIVYDPYFSDSNDWYLFADPARVPAFAVGFLNGQQRPQVYLKNPEVRNALGGDGADPYTFELDSIDWKVRFDFGAAPVDPRGTARSVVP